MANMSNELPTHHRAMVLTSVDVPPTIESIPTPRPIPGTAVFRVLTTMPLSYTREVFQSTDPNYRAYPFPLPLVPGFAAIGRIVAVADDATSLKPGQLVIFDPFVRSRDLDGTSSAHPAQFLSAFMSGSTDRSRHLMTHGGIRDGSFAEYMRAMLENCYILDEARLTGPRPGGLGYSIGDLNALVTLMVPYGGMRAIDVRPGETVLVSPSTGPFGGAACMVALALGAKVIAWGRSVEKLERLKKKLSTINSGRYEGMIDTIPLTSDADADLKNVKTIAKNGVDVFFDISPPVAQGSHHLKTGILSLRHTGRVNFMGGLHGDVSLPHRFIMSQDITIKGKWMYERSDVVELIKMIERGVLPIGERGGWEVVQTFKLEEWKEAWDLAYEKSKLGEMVLIAP